MWKGWRGCCVNSHLLFVWKVGGGGGDGIGQLCAGASVTIAGFMAWVGLCSVINPSAYFTPPYSTLPLMLVWLLSPLCSDGGIECVDL